jgi:hypothetical protein
MPSAQRPSKFQIIATAAINSMARMVLRPPTGFPRTI